MSNRDDKSIPETHPGHLAGLATESGSSTSKGSTFVKAIGGTARSLLKTLDRSFSLSMAERGDEVSSMTIEFLYSRLQAQRIVYKAEKQRVQQLVKKVLELEQKLNLEIARRKDVECRDVLISPRYRSYSLRTRDSPHCNERACMSNKEDKGKGITVGHFNDDSYQAIEHKTRHTGCCPRIIDGGGAHHADGHEVSSVTQFSLCHQCECLRRNCEELPSQHQSHLDKQFNATYNEKCIQHLMEKGNRENKDWGMESAHLKEQKTILMSEIIQMDLITKDLYHDLLSWNNVLSIDTDDYKETAQNMYASLDFKETPGLSHRFLCGESARKARSFPQHTNSSSIASLEHVSLDNCSARAINNQPGDHNEKSLNSPNKVNLGAFTGASISPPIS